MCVTHFFPCETLIKSGRFFRLSSATEMSRSYVQTLRRKALSATSAARCQHFTSTYCGFAGSKAVAAFANQHAWLICSFHFASPPSNIGKISIAGLIRCKSGQVNESEVSFLVIFICLPTVHKTSHMHFTPVEQSSQRLERGFHQPLVLTYNRTCKSKLHINMTSVMIMRSS